MFLRILALLMIIPAMVACSRGPKPQPPSVAQEGEEKQVYVGLASFYGYDFKGNQTANSSSYDPTKLTAAHRTLPFGTQVLVTNLENNRSVTVTITDRGPEKKDRIIDLSFAAAQALNMLSQGVVKVRVEVLNE